MAMKPGDIVRTWTPEQHAKLLQANELLRAHGPQGSKRIPGIRKAFRLHPKLFTLVLVCLVLSIGAYGYASVTILVPSIPVHGIYANCPSAIPSKSSVLLNTSGFVLVTCGGRGILRILSGTVATANYSLPSPYLDLVAYPAGQDSLILNRCTEAPAAIPLGHPWTAGYTGNWSFCADYGPVQTDTLPGFSVGWSIA